MQNSIDKKEEDMMTIKREDYRYTPKEGFVLTHFLTVAMFHDQQTLSSYSWRKSHPQWITHHYPDCQ